MDINMFRLEEAYSQAIRMLRNIVEDIRVGRQLYMNSVDIYSAQVCKYLNDDLVTSEEPSTAIPPIASVTHVGSPANNASYSFVLK